VLVIDDTAMPKNGDRSVGVAPVGERRSTGEQKYYVSNLPAERPTSSSRRSLGSTTSKVDPGRDYIDTR
jgi:hypothetical protein